MLQIFAWPRAILHLDGNAFFASVMQAVYPRLRGKPVVVGAERGIATAISYEAKAYGIKRGTLTGKARELCPEVVVLPGDYELFSLYSQKMFAVLRRYSPTVEEYSIDEGFMDLTGLRRPLHLSYSQMAAKIQADIARELDLPVSAGVSLTKSLAKLASGFRKPRGLTLVSGRHLETFLAKVAVGEVWGIGPATASYLNKFNIKTALDFVNLPPTVFGGKSSLRLNKNHREIWQELRGELVYSLNPDAKNHYKSISKTRTFRPASSNYHVVWAELLNNVEQAFNKARQYGYLVRKMAVFLKTSQFRYFGTEIRFMEKQEYPMLFREPLRQAFSRLFNPNQSYRATGCVLVELSETKAEQASLFQTHPAVAREKARALYETLGSKQVKVDFGASLYLRTTHAKEQPKREDGLPRFNLPILEI